MKNVMNGATSIAFGLVLLGGLATSAAAQKGGSGGGGGGGSSQRHGGSYNLTFDRNGTIAGSRSTCAGGYNLTTYVTTLSVDYKLNNCSLPDGTLVFATVYSTDYYTGAPWQPMLGGVSVLQGGKTSFHNPNVVTTGLFGLPVVNTVVLTLEDGTVIFVGHP